jgi:transglutaminase-like putative cysteine protease
MDGPDPGKTARGRQGAESMIFRIAHQVSYIYSAPVYLEPHILSLRPRDDASQQLTRFSLDIEPEPSGRHDFLDAAGNCCSCLWFSEKTAALKISTDLEVRTLVANPYSYLVTDPDFMQLPASYKGTEFHALAPFLTPLESGAGTIAFAEAIKKEARGNTLEFLSRLCSMIYESFTVEIRDHGLPLPPEVTLLNKQGACRDLAVLYMEVCRNIGLAARFVSGYQEGDPEMEGRYLHAWVEVYVPGGGWRGYDPTLGLAVADRHIALAASHDPEGVVPVKGSFRGTGVAAEMNFNISLAAVSEG